MRLRFSVRVGPDDEPYALAHIAANTVTSTAALNAILSAAAHRLTVGGPERIVVIEGNIEDGPSLYGAPALVADVRGIDAALLERGTFWAPRDLDV